MDVRAALAPRRTAEATAYVALSGAIGLSAFVALLPLVILSGALMVLALMGLLFLWGEFLACHVLALLERHRAAALLGVEFRVRPLGPPEGNPLKRMLAWTRSRGSWLELCYALIALPFVGFCGAVLVFAAFGVAIAFLTFPLWGWAAAGGGTVLGLHVGFAAAAVLHVVVGTAALVAAPPLARGVAAVQVAMARLLLEPGANERLTARVDTLEQTRAGMVSAADAERRRIERDIHDGPQQQFVALAVNLQLARQLAESDPSAVPALLDELSGDLRAALDEVRELAGSVYPPLLRERGLAESLRSATSASVEATLTERYAPEIEATAYFCCVAALQEVDRPAVRLWAEPGELHFEASAGHADLTDAGDRVAALGGRLEIANGRAIGFLPVPR
jgi:signal transduction histidine kinase